MQSLRANPLRVFLCLSLMTFGVGNALAMTWQSLPVGIEFTVGYDISTVPGADVFNRNAGTSLDGNFTLSNFEQPGNGLLPSPLILARAEMLTPRQLRILIAGGSIVAGEHTRLDDNDLSVIHSMVSKISFSEKLGERIQTIVEKSVDGGVNYIMLQEHTDFHSERLENGITEFEIEVLKAALDGASPPLDTSFSITFTIVPVPQAVWLFASALGLLGWMNRRSF